MSSGSERTQEDVVSSFRELREYSRGELDVDHSDVHRWTGLVDDPIVREVLAFMASNYDPSTVDGDMPSRFSETEFFERAIRKYGTRVATEAIRDGNLSQTAFMAGLPGYNADVSGLHTIQKLESWLLDDVAQLVYLAGHMGNGKTDFAHLMVEVVEHRLGALGEEVDIRTNIESSEYQTLNHYEELKEWMQSGGHELNKWMVFDEASSELSGYSHDRAKVEQLLSSLVKKMRKNGVNLIIIGHTGKDLHADLRRLCDYVQKRSLKTASFYASVKNGDGAGHLFDLDGIPETSKRFDTEDEAEWHWGDALEEDSDGISESELKELRNERIARLYYESSITQSDLSGAFDVSVRTVRRILSESDRGDGDQ